MPTDPHRLRTCLGQFPTGVTVVSCAVGDSVHGATVNAFSAVSLEPALVMVSLDRRSKACRYLSNRPFTVNVLAEGQDSLALLFAGHATGARPCWRPDLGLAGAVAILSCTPWAEYDGGDHLLFLGRVETFDWYGGAPLVFHGGTFRRLTPAAPVLPVADDPHTLLSRLGGRS